MDSEPDFLEYFPGKWRKNIHQLCKILKEDTKKDSV